MPLTIWIAGSVALISTVILVAAPWFDSLFEAPSAFRASSFVQHLGSRSVLGVFAHPDDETLAAGALADAAGRSGIDVRTITLTHGERGFAEPHISRREDLRLVRESELRRYGFALGIDHQEVWDYPSQQALRPVRGFVKGWILRFEGMACRGCATACPRLPPEALTICGTR